VFTELRRYEEAFAAYDRALALKPDFAEAWLSRGNVFFDLKQYKNAYAACDKALMLNPDIKFAAGVRLLAKLHMCDWTSLETEIAQLLLKLRERKLSITPFAILAIPSSPADQLQCAKQVVQDRPPFPQVWRGDIYTHNRIRVAYLSADFGEHPVAHSAIGLFENHNRSRFEVSGISFGPPDSSAMQHRIETAVEHFIDVRDQNDQDIANLMRRLEIDIAVDLMGFTKDNRFNIFARRPAPIQISYLGYLGTLGADFIDYVIADEIAVPPDQQEHYAETIVHLSDCFLVNDDKLSIAPRTPSRSDVGLPDEGFVFCSFNNSYKFGRAMFETWMRLLHAIEGSVLWLLETNPEMIINLRREAQRCGVNPGRIVFARRIALPDHLARQRLASLFLDTVPYNAGATAAAALWAGVPVLTVIGESFVGRMAASMLHAIGLSELTTSSLEEYERIALKLANNPALLATVKDKLARNRNTFPLFNTERATRQIESAYTMMWERYRGGAVSGKSKPICIA
jgi:predicted O-linked N-acetylglucosamine transferase (SPINDLY family)